LTLLTTFIDKGRRHDGDTPVSDTPLPRNASDSSSLSSVFCGKGIPVAPHLPVEETSEESEDDYVYKPWTNQQKEEAAYTRLANKQDRKFRANMRAEYEERQKKQAEAHKAKEQAVGETEKQKKARQQEEKAKKNLAEMEANSRSMLRRLRKRLDWPYPIQTSVSALF